MASVNAQNPTLAGLATAYPFPGMTNEGAKRGVQYLRWILGHTWGYQGLGHLFSCYIHNITI